MAMTTPYEAIVILINTKEPIPKQEIMEWIKTGDLRVRGAIYALTEAAWSRILPEITMNEQCDFMADYLLECLEKNPTAEEYLHSGYEAAWEVADWMKHLLTIAGSTEILVRIANRLAGLYRASDLGTRERIVNGALEHIFEEKRLMPFFEYWRDDIELRGAYQEAMDWGQSHRH